MTIRNTIMVPVEGILVTIQAVRDTTQTPRAQWV